MENTNTNQNGWHNSRGKKCCDALFNMIPTSLQLAFKTFTVYTATKGDLSKVTGVTGVTGKLSLFAAKEVCGKQEGSYPDEFNDNRLSWISFYKNNLNLKKPQMVRIHIGG